MNWGRWNGASATVCLLITSKARSGEQPTLRQSPKDTALLLPPGSPTRTFIRLILCAMWGANQLGAGTASGCIPPAITHKPRIFPFFYQHYHVHGVSSSDSTQSGQLHPQVHGTHCYFYPAIFPCGISARSHVHPKFQAVITVYYVF